MKKIIYCLSLLIILLTCQKEDEICGKELMGDTLVLSNTARNCLASYTNASKIIFNEIGSGNEVEFLIEEYKDTLVEYNTNTPCLEDTSKVNQVSGMAQWIQLEINNQLLARNIIIRLTKFPNNVEELLMFYGEVQGVFFDFSNLQGMLAHLPTATSSFTTFADSVAINGKVFFEVIEPDLSNPGFNQPFNPPIEVKFSKSQGIIYMNDKLNARELVFNRIE